MKIKQLSSIIICLVLFVSANTAMAQFSAGLETGLPLGDFSTVSNAGFGVSGRYEANIQDNINWTASIGYLSFGGKDFLGGKYGTVSVIPVVGGAKYYFNEKDNGWYGAADLGFSFISYSVADPNSGNGNGVTFENSSVTRFGLSPGVGYRMGNWDFTGRFNLMSDFNYMGVRAAYVFGIK